MSSYQTVYLSTVDVVKRHDDNIREYLKDKLGNVMVANLDDYHDICTNRIPDMSTNSKILHMATTLINTPPNIPAILNNVNVHQTGLLDARRINFTFKGADRYYVFLFRGVGVLVLYIKN